MPKKTIMVVDDEVEILKVVENILKIEGYHVVKAKNGIEALKKLKNIKPDLILLDFFMPKMSGRDVCKKIRADDKLKDLKVAFVTVARFSKQGIKQLKDMDVLDYITKPFEYKDLINRVKKIVG